MYPCPFPPTKSLPRGQQMFVFHQAFVVDYICITETLHIFFFFSFQKTDLSFACAVLPHNNNPYFCGNTGESRVLSGTFKSLQFHNRQTEGDLQTEGAKVQVFYHNAFYRLETKSIHRQTHFTPSSLKEKLI